MTAEEFINKTIPNHPLKDEAHIIAFINSNDWWHVHRNEELPDGHVQSHIRGKRVPYCDFNI